MLQNSWSIQLQEQPTHFIVCSLEQPTIIYQSTSTQLISHSNKQSFRLPIRKEILAIDYLTPIASSIASSGIGQACHILILTRYQLSCYDLLSNNQIYTIEFQNARMLNKSPPFLYVVSDSDIYCLKVDGQEDSVNHLATTIQCILPLSDHSVIAALADSTMCRYKGVNIILDYGKVIGQVSCITEIGNGIAIGTQEGIIAYYQSRKYKWKAKSNHRPIALLTFKSSTEGTSCLIVGRYNGGVELRDWSNGDTLSKVKMGQQLIGFTIYDYRLDGYEQLMCVCKSGSVKVFNIKQSTNQQPKNNQLPLAQQIKQRDQNIQQYVDTKNNLEFQVTRLKEALKAVEGNEGPQSTGEHLGKELVLSAQLFFNKGLFLKVGVQGGYISGLSFEEPILPYLTFEKSSTLNYRFTNDNTITGQINCEALVHTNYLSKEYEIKQFKVLLPKLWKWQFIQQPKLKIEGYAKFKINQRNSRYIKWMEQCFIWILSEQMRLKMEMMPMLKARFYNYYDNQQLEIIIISKQSKVEIWCDCLITLGQIVQDLVSYLKLKDLNSQLYFPKEKQKLKEILLTIERLSQTKASISSEMSQAINQIKFLLVKGETSRTVGNINQMRKAYQEVMEQNALLNTQISKKNLNTKQLSDSLKVLSQIINLTSNVRHGESKSQMVYQCREAIKNKDFPKIISIMQRGVIL